MPHRPHWMPDWRGECCVIVASGPSIIDYIADIAQCSAKIIAINTSWELVPWADIIYGCDYAWWKSVEGLKGHRSLKLCGDARILSHDWGVDHINVRQHDQLVFDEPGVVGRGGGSSAFQALNIAVQSGCRHIVLAGVDCDITYGLHWHGAHGQGLTNPKESLVRKWRKALDCAAPSLKDKKITVVNASSRSTLTAYPKLNFNQAIHMETL